MARWFDVGDRVRLRVAFSDEEGDAADPTAVALTVRDPANAETTPTVEQDEDDDAEPVVGSYHAYVTLDRAGTWRWRWAGTGAVVAATEGTIDVRASAFD